MATYSLAMHTSDHGEDIPTDISVQVGEAMFSLHKIMLVAKSNYIKRIIIEEPDLGTIDLCNFPGGAEIFDKIVKFCYGVNFEITVNNVAPLHCAAVHLEMTDELCEPNLANLTHGFLTHVALTSLSGAITALKSCEDLLPEAQQLNIVDQCVKVVSAKACEEADFPTCFPQNRWVEELTKVNINFFRKIINSMKSQGAKSLAIASAITTYANRCLPKIIFNRSINSIIYPKTDDSLTFTDKQREILDTVVDLLSIETRQTIFPINFLCRLLCMAILQGNNGGCMRKLEKRISAILEYVTVDDLIMLSFRFDGERVCDVECVRRIVTGFVEKKSMSVDFDKASCLKGMVRVAKTIDAYLSEIASDGQLSISQFNGLANLVPKNVREVDDDLYRAIDIYLQAHPNMDEIELEKACSAMDPLKLSVEARIHASQNKRLPLQIVLHTLYFDQLQVRSGQSTPTAQSMRLQLDADEKLAKENEKLRSELLWMKMYVSDMEKNQKVASGSKTKKPTFFSSVSKTLGKLNPFKHGSKDTANIDDQEDLRTKPRRRRFSMS